MFKISYGPHYIHAHKGTMAIKKFHSVKRIKAGWLVHEIHTGEAKLVIPHFENHPHVGKLRAYYAAQVYNGVDMSVVFNFGTDMFA